MLAIASLSFPMPDVYVNGGDIKVVISEDEAVDHHVINVLFIFLINKKTNV